MSQLKRAFWILWTAFNRFDRNDGWSMAGFIAFSGLLSLFPFLIFAATLVGILVGPDRSDVIIESLFEIAPEDVVTVKNSALASGPAITGSIQPERRADLRAEVQAIVLQVLRENGDAVKQGDLLVRLDATAIRDSLASAESAARGTEGVFATELGMLHFKRA